MSLFNLMIFKIRKLYFTSPVWSWWVYQLVTLTQCGTVASSAILFLLSIPHCQGGCSAGLAQLGSAGCCSKPLNWSGHDGLRWTGFQVLPSCLGWPGWPEWLPHSTVN